MEFRHIPSLFFESVKKWYGDQVSMFAAALAFYTIFAIAPMIIFMVSLSSVIFRREEARSWLLGNADPFFGPEVMVVARNILDNIRNAPATLLATLIALAAFLLVAMRIISHLRISFNSIWEVPPRRDGGMWGLLKGHFSSFFMVIVAMILLLMLAIASAILSAASSFFDQMFPQFGSVVKMSDIIVTMTLGTGLFAVMFKFLPDMRILWGDVWIGAGFTAFLFLAGKKIFSLYFASDAIRSLYGAAGSFVIVILWIYCSAQIVFFGAEFTRVYAKRYGSHRKDSVPAP